MSMQTKQGFHNSFSSAQYNFQELQHCHLLLSILTVRPSFAYYLSNGANIRPLVKSHLFHVHWHTSGGGWGRCCPLSQRRALQTTRAHVRSSQSFSFHMHPTLTTTTLSDIRIVVFCFARYLTVLIASSNFRRSCTIEFDDFVAK